MHDSLFSTQKPKFNRDVHKVKNCVKKKNKKKNKHSLNSMFTYKKYNLNRFISLFVPYTKYGMKIILFINFLMCLQTHTKLKCVCFPFKSIIKY